MMIGILDQFEIKPSNLADLYVLIDDRYLVGAVARGMTLKSTWVSPPVALRDAPRSRPIAHLKVHQAACIWCGPGASTG